MVSVNPEESNDPSRAPADHSLVGWREGACLCHGAQAPRNGEISLLTHGPKLARMRDPHRRESAKGTGPDRGPPGAQGANPWRAETSS